MRNESMAILWKRWETKLLILESRIGRAIQTEKPVAAFVDREIVHARSQISNLQKNIEEYVMENAVLKEKLAERERQLRNMEIECRRKSDEIMSQQYESERTKNNIEVFVKNIGSRLAVLEAEKNSAQSNSVYYSGEKKVLENELRALRDEAKKYSEQKNELQQAQTAASQTVKEKESEIAILYSRMRKLEEERESLIEEIRKMRIEHIIKKNGGGHERHRRASMLYKILRWFLSPLVNVEVEK